MLESLQRHKPNDRPGFQNRAGAHTDVVLATLARPPGRRGPSIGRLLLLIVAACVLVVIAGAWVVSGRSPWSLLDTLRPTMTAQSPPATQPTSLPAPRAAAKTAAAAEAPAGPVGRAAAPASPAATAAAPASVPDADAGKVTANNAGRLAPTRGAEKTAKAGRSPAVEKATRPAAAQKGRDGKRLATAKKPAPATAGPENAVPTPAGVLAAPATKPAARLAATTGAASAPAGAVTRGVKVLNPASPSAGEFKLAVYYHQSGDFEKALFHYRAFIEQEPLNVEAHNNLGLLYQSKGLTQDAIKEFKSAITIDQSYIKAHNNLGVTLLNTGSVDAAASEFRWLLAQDSKNVDAMVNLALAQKAGDRMEEARETLLKAIGLKPTSAVARYNLALIYEGQGEYTRAIDHYEAFLKYSSTDQAALAADVRARLQSLRQKVGQG